jgi:hypothetical protein
MAPAALQFAAVEGAISGFGDLAISSSAPQGFTLQIDDGKGGLAPEWLKATQAPHRAYCASAWRR